NVRVVRWLDAECAENFNMFGRVGKMVFAADHVRDFHLEVVDHVYEMKNPRSVRPPDRHIGMRAWIGEIEIDFTADEIVHDDVLPWRTEAQRALVFEDVATILKFLQVTFVDLS